MCLYLLWHSNSQPSPSHLIYCLRPLRWSGCSSDLPSLFFLGLLHLLFLHMECFFQLLPWMAPFRQSTLLKFSSTRKPSRATQSKTAVPTSEPYSSMLTFLIAFIMIWNYFTGLLVYCLSPPLESNIHESRKCGCPAHWSLPRAWNNLLAAQSKSSGTKTCWPI